jgi:hypothetical protein
MRTFETGATRDGNVSKIDYEAHLCPETLHAYCEFLHAHRALPDGSRRDADNWQKGMEPDVWIESLVRHSLQLWRLHRGFRVVERKPDGSEIEITKYHAVCGVLFNAFGYLRELITHS